ncbi:MAG: hypothetical protein ACD_51C00280G0009 [uncultured bacterium]|nr:MAG: hypothetical protein ACD_51C00280G0009 [uncultured bacterium]OGJ47558.1 MAG: hypothetical protein A2244_00630 [Candidatus Peregrinibacteria bacterium RIFOXYA2_FULL_41_18]OGJ49641.1 MAG: hypothetical protein A2344_02480 [Candidatus Peregrinibacteria bacterium RIFOXYB12_FULL_41_12]OGJ53088.1 MAG: hypothetical protein A2448_04745 [Candidatus Peregrinibacteria bacterium RIFOXYC2_FULL_41_22]OGJ53900.1 MAG: hypothetical protein A2336_00605 [Candidatus Peregrinibacteria bacterium RIFOXYB2_FULL
MLFRHIKKLNWGHIALVGLVCSALSLLVLALMTVAPQYLFSFVEQNSLYSLGSWLFMVMVMLAITAEVLVLMGPAVFYTVKEKDIILGMKVLFSSLVMVVLLTLVVVAVFYFAWGTPLVIE